MVHSRLIQLSQLESCLYFNHTIETNTYVWSFIMDWIYPSYGQSAGLSAYSQTTLQNKFFAYIQDNNIIADRSNGPAAIGVTMETYQTLKDTAAKYRDRLKELVPEEMEPPPTTEQINERLLSELKEERVIRQKLLTFIEELTGPKKEDVINEPTINTALDSEAAGGQDRS